MISIPRMTDKQEEYIMELYKAHFTIKEATEIVPFSYPCLATRWRKFKFAKIEKYDRLDLIEGGLLANAQTG